MKKNIYLTTAGCSQNEVTEVSPDSHPAVGFDVYTGNHTRGTDVTNTTMQGVCDETHYGGFGIMGYYTGSASWSDDMASSVAPDYMHNQKVTYNTIGTTWEYSPVKYWPNNPADKISFFAYAPYEPDWEHGTKTGVVVSAKDQKGLPSIVFNLKKSADLKQMVDLVVAQTLDQTYESNSGKVDFSFDHTLSRISFNVKLGDGNYDGMDGENSFIYVTRMWIVGNDEAATNMSWLTPKMKNTHSKFYTKATWAGLQWNYDGAKATIPTEDFSLIPLLNVDNVGVDEVNPADGTSTKVYGVKIDKNAKTTPVSLFLNKGDKHAENQYLYLIPVADTRAEQADGTGGCEKGDITIGFHYDIVSKSTTDENKYLVSHAEAKIELPAHHMKRKKSYVYTLVINPRGIEIGNVAVTPWDDKSENVDVN